MLFCEKCGRPEAERSRVCRGCGGSLTRSAPPGVAGGSSSARRTISAAGTPGRIALIVIVVIVLAAGAGAGIRLAGRHEPSRASGTPIIAPSATEPASSGSPVPSSPAASPAASSLSAAGTTSDGALTITVGAGQEPGASLVASFLDSYFSAINTHDYQAYLALLSQRLRQGLSQASFDSGYAATADSRETLVGISAADGDVVARVKFTSHQEPDAANHDESCTKWRISLFLEETAGGYLIDPAPLGYHAGSAPC